MTNRVTNPKKRLFFKKSERITAKLLFQQLFQAGSSFKSHGVRFVYKFNTDDFQEYPAKIAFAVPKKNCKKAVRRNQIKRKLREAFRLSKTELWHILNEQKRKIQIVCVYSSSDVVSLSHFQNAFAAFYKKVL